MSFGDHTGRNAGVDGWKTRGARARHCRHSLVIVRKKQARTVIAMTPDRSFTSDNTAGGAPEIIAAVAAAASGQAPPYGTDSWTSSARRRFSEIFDRDVDLLPVSTGSAANALSLAALTPPWGSVLCVHRDLDFGGAKQHPVESVRRDRSGRLATGSNENACARQCQCHCQLSPVNRPSSPDSVNQRYSTQPPPAPKTTTVRVTPEPLSEAVTCPGNRIALPASE